MSALPPASREPEREAAQARGRAYALLADLLARGPVPALLAPARASDTLARALDATGDADEAAADHQHAFGFCVPPLAGTFLDPEGAAGGESAARLSGTFAALGFRPDPRVEEPEHLATLLRALAFLSGAEADALEDGRPEVVAELRRLATQVLGTHVLAWLPPFAAAVRRVGRPFPTALVDQIEALVRFHLDGLPEPPAAPPLEGAPLDLDDPEVDLRAIAHYLTTPSRAGVFLGRDDIARVGRAFQLPRGFGGRALLMQNLLRAAARYDALGQACAAFEAILDAADAELGAWPEAVSRPWRMRAEATRAVLRRLAEAEPARLAEED